MKVHVLGSAAGGGLPQWNCGCPGCAAARSGAILPRTQDSVAVTADGERWVLLNASPDVRQQLQAFCALHPFTLRHSPLTAVVLTNADVDHCLGLFVLREGSPLSVYATAAVLRCLRSHDALCRTLERQPGQTRWSALATGGEMPLLAADGTATGLTVEALPVPGKLPPHLVGLAEPSPEDDVALLVRSTKAGFTLGYAPCVGADAIGVARVLREADVVLFDGTFWSSDELVALGVGNRTAEDMAHWKLSGRDGSLGRLRAGVRGRVLLTHVNNTNPILRNGPERRAVLAAGIGIADDGLELEA